MAPYASTSSSTRYRSHVCQPQFQWNSTGGRRKLFVSRVPSLFINVSPVTLLCCHLRSSWGTFTGILVLSLTGMIPPALGSSASASAHTPWPLSSPKLLVMQGQVQAPPQYLPDLRLTLNGGLLSVAPSASGTFEIGPLRPGSYLLQPSHPLLHLSSYLVKVPTSSSEAPQVFALGDSFRPVVKLSLPLVIAPLGLSPPLYFAIKPPFSLLVLLQQPLLLVAIACCALMWCLPRLQQYQEEDERQQRAALLQHQDLLARHNLPNDHHTNNQERYGDGGRITPAATSWRGDERGRYRADVDDGVEAEEVQSEDYIDHSAFSKCLASMRPPGGSQSFCIR